MLEKIGGSIMNLPDFLLNMFLINLLELPIQLFLIAAALIQPLYKTVFYLLVGNANNRQKKVDGKIHFKYFEKHLLQTQEKQFVAGFLY